ncbi:MAG: hypothetical protein WDW38_000102 [Sanguina aurantia]
MAGQGGTCVGSGQCLLPCVSGEHVQHNGIQVGKLCSQIVTRASRTTLQEAHADVIIERCCNISWPRDRILIQVLDDSTKEHIRKKVDDMAAVCVENGHPVSVVRRTNRSGFKAGAMVEGLTVTEGQGYEYAAIFDADFDPPTDFLEETIYHMHFDRKLAFVQTRWTFSNSDTFLTWAQKVNLAFHFDVEQRARSYLGWFFNFNGTAGVWRIAAIHDAGGWESDTVVEDMDLSLRCYLKGWTALYVPYVDNPNELPCTLSSYRTQQFRWLSGPMQILMKSFRTIWKAKDIGFFRRLNCYWFFCRYVLFAVITICVLAVPPVAIWVDKWEWEWPEIFFIISINFAMAVYLVMTPFSIAYLLFSVSVGYFKTYAMLSGLIGSKKSKTWKVTQKYNGSTAGGWWTRFRKPYAIEFTLFAYYGGLAGACAFSKDWMMMGYCAVMALVFLLLSFGDMLM